MGWFLIFYSETVGIILNVLISLAGLGACFWSFHTMAQKDGVKLTAVLRRSFYTFFVHVLAVTSATALCFLLAFFMDVIHLPMSWFSHSWLILGLYFCPLFFGFAIIPAIYFHKTQDVSELHAENFYRKVSV